MSKVAYEVNLWVASNDKGFKTEKVASYELDSHPPLYPNGTHFVFGNNPKVVKETRVRYARTMEGNALIVHDIMLGKGE